MQHRATLKEGAHTILAVARQGRFCHSSGMSAAAPTEAEIFSHAFTSLDSPEAGTFLRIIENLRLPESDLDRVDYLAAKARDGSITAAEQAELEKYLRVGNFLDQIRAWALRRNGKKASP
jgi:hypothetical protein